MTVPPAAMSAAVMAAAAAPVRVAGVQVQEIHPNRVLLLYIHLIQLFQHFAHSFKTEPHCYRSYQLVITNYKGIIAPCALVVKGYFCFPDTQSLRASRRL